LGLVPLVLVLAAAVFHAGWNLLAKRAAGGLVFVWLCGLAGLVCWAPAALVQLLLRTSSLSVGGALFMAGSGLWHVGYFSSLQEAYNAGELSTVYPIVRGTGPLLTVIGALLILHEQASALTLLGAGLIVVAIMSLARGARSERARPAIALAVLTGAFTAAYTVWDTHAVTTLHQPVIVYYWGAELVRAAVLATPALRRRGQMARVWQEDRLEVIGVGLLVPAAYILVLTALTLAPAIVVAPVREVSIVFGVLIGATALGEGDTLKRTIAALIILAGIVLIVIG
jgi:drug/metabolite transporter (DMT)-like permease